jgi:hypothetical protein
MLSKLIRRAMQSVLDDRDKHYPMNPRAAPEITLQSNPTANNRRT